MIYLNKDNVFLLQTKKTSYVFRALPTGQLESMYYGRKIRNIEDCTFLYGFYVAYSWANRVSWEMSIIDIEFGQNCDMILCAQSLATFFGQYPVEFVF